MIGKAREHMKTQQLHQVLNAVWAVVADANRYFASRGALGAGQDRSAAAGHDALRHRRGAAAGRHPGQPFMPASAAKLLDHARRSRRASAIFAELGGDKRIAAGAALPPPAPVFPRYVEPEAAA